MYKLINTILIVESKDKLHKEFEDDVCAYFDVEGKDGNGMEYEDGYLVLDCSVGEIYYIIFK